DATSKTGSVEPPRSDHRSQSTGHGAAAAGAKPLGGFARPILAPEQSAILRERLLDQLAAIGSADEAAIWAQRNLPAKNLLTAIDAKIVEERFQAKPSTISDGQAPDGMTPAATPDGLPPARPPDP